MRIAKVAMTNTSPSSGPRRFSQVRARFEPKIAGLEFISAIILSVVVSESRAVARGSYIQVEHSIRSHPHAGCPRRDPGPLPVLTRSLQILIQRRVQQGLGFAGVQIVEGDHGNAGVD